MGTKDDEFKSNIPPYALQMYFYCNDAEIERIESENYLDNNFVNPYKCIIKKCLNKKEP